MHKKITFLLIFSSLFILSCTKANHMVRLNPPIKSFVKIHNSIEIKSCKGDLPKKLTQCPIGVFHSTGSGMAVAIVSGKSIVITAGHLCAPTMADFISEYQNVIRVQDHTGRMHQAHLIKSSLDNSIGNPDMCALHVPSLAVKEVRVSRRPPLIGEHIYYIGAPKGVFHPPTAAILTGIFSGPIDASSSMVTAPAAPGASGAVILDYNNRMLGVLYATHPGFRHITLITSYKSTMVFLNDVRKIITKK
jgi:hypothetical protein